MKKGGLTSFPWNLQLFEPLDIGPSMKAVASDQETFCFLE